MFQANFIYYRTLCRIMDIIGFLADPINMVGLLSSFVIIACCIAILLMTRRIYSLTGHVGIRAFRMAFLFFGIYFFLKSVNSVIVNAFPADLAAVISLVLQAAYTFAISMGGLYLVYSLVWKEFSTQREPLLYVFSIAVAIINHFVWYMIYVSEIVAFTIGLVLSYSNYQNALAAGKRHFSEFYFIAVALALFSFIINFIIQFIIPSPRYLIYVALMNAGVFAIYTVGVYAVLKWPRKEKG
jgi:hypothetical protein